MTQLRLDLVNDERIQGLMRELAGAKVRQAARGAGRQAWRPMLHGVKARVPEDTGLLKRVLGLRQKTVRGTVITKVGVAKDATVTARAGRNAKRLERRGLFAKAKRTQKRSPAEYLHLLERGTRPHTIPLKRGGTVQHPGTAAQGILTRSFQSNRSLGETIFMQAMIRLMRREVARAGGTG